MHSYPHHPQKKNNQAICQYPEFLERQWEFENESNDREAEEEEEEYDMVDVVNIGGRVLMKGLRRKDSVNNTFLKHVKKMLTWIMMFINFVTYCYIKNR